MTGVRFLDVVHLRKMFVVKSWSIFELAFGAAALLAFTASLVAVPGGRGLLGGGLAVVDRDDLIEAGQLEDLAVVIAEAVGEDLLVVSLRAHEQRHEQADPARVHVLE